jgi:hypothetical protein
MQREPEPGESFPEVLQKDSRRPYILNPDHTIVGVANRNNVSSPWLLAPVLNP